SSPSTRTVRASSKTPRPPTISTPFDLATLARPRASLPITRSDFHLRSGSSDTRGAPKSTPNSFARSASASTAATWSSALEGMQPSKRRAPPRRLPASTTTVSSPSSAQRNAAEYPPGPPPITTTSTSRTRSPITIASPPRREQPGGTGHHRRHLAVVEAGAAHGLRQPLRRERSDVRVDRDRVTQPERGQRRAYAVIVHHEVVDQQAPAGAQRLVGAGEQRAGGRLADRGEQIRHQDRVVVHRPRHVARIALEVRDALGQPSLAHQLAADRGHARKVDDRAGQPGRALAQHDAEGAAAPRDVEQPPRPREVHELRQHVGGAERARVLGDREGARLFGVPQLRVKVHALAA